MRKTKNKYQYILKWSKKIKLINSLGNVCCNCGCDNVLSLEFHHPLNDKECSINNVQTCRLSVMMKEADKCVLLCRNCHAELHYDEGGTDRRRSILKEKMLEYKNVFCCEKCGHEGSNYRSLEFHHKNPSEKSFELFSEVWKVKKIKKKGIEEIILRELDKCEVICRNCHGIEHIDVEKFNTWESDIYEKIDSYKEANKIDKDLVLSMYNNGIRQIDIAKELNCAKSSICYLIKKYRK